MSTDRSALDALGGWLARGRRAVREDARRALHELVARGDLSESDARQVEEAVAAAVERSSELFTGSVLAPLQELWRGARSAAAEPAPGISERLDRIVERLERLERRLDERLERERDAPRASDDGGDAPCS